MLDGKTFICKGWEPGKGAVEKTVKVLGTLDGPENDPRDYALMLVEDGLITSADLAMMLVKYMSHDDVKDCLDANEISPRFGNM